MSRKVDMRGVRSGRLLVVSEVKGRKRISWLCLCNCGNKVIVSSDNLRHGNTKSCGCLRKEVTGKLKRTHGLSSLKEYAKWALAIDRCHKENNFQYKDYGGRGIRVCKRWRNSFEAFYKDMGPCPPGLTLERINNDKGYFPRNCKWATWDEQCRNRRTNVWVVYKGKRIIFFDLVKKVGLTTARKIRLAAA